MFDDQNDGQRIDRLEDSVSIKIVNSRAVFTAMYGMMENMMCNNMMGKFGTSMM